MQLRNNDAFRPVHDERAIRRHQRNVAEEDFLLLDVADRLRTRLRVLVVNRQANRDLERRREGHAALFALLLVVLQLQANGVAALVAEVRRVLVVGSAVLAEHIAGMEGIRNDHRTAVDAGGSQVMQTLQVAALTLPVADGKVHKIKLRNVAEVRNREHRCKDRLQTIVVALVGELVHLQKPLIGAPLHFNQVGNLDGGRNLGKIESAANGAILVRHASLLRLVSPMSQPRFGLDTGSPSLTAAGVHRNAVTCGNPSPQIGASTFG